MVKQKSLNMYLAVLLILIFAAVVVWALQPFITALLVGIILATILVSPHEYLTKKLKLGNRLSSLLAILLSIFIIVIPLLGLLFVIGGEVEGLIQDPSFIISGVESIDKLIPQIDLVSKVRELIPEIGTFFVKLVAGFLSATGSLFW